MTLTDTEKFMSSYDATQELEMVEALSQSAAIPLESRELFAAAIRSLERKLQMLYARHKNLEEENRALTAALRRSRWIEGATEAAAGSRPAEGVSSSGKATGNGVPADFRSRVASVETELLVTALARSRGRISAAARLLGITPRMIRYKIKKLRIDLQNLPVDPSPRQ